MMVRPEVERALAADEIEVEVGDSFLALTAAGVARCSFSAAGVTTATDILHASMCGDRAAGIAPCRRPADLRALPTMLEALALWQGVPRYVPMGSSARNS